MTRDDINQNSDIKYDYRNLITQLRHRVTAIEDSIIYVIYYSYDEAGNRFAKTVYKYIGIGEPSDTPSETDAPINPNWELHNQEFYSRDVSGRELAIYKNGEILQYPTYGLDMIGYLKENEPHYYYKDHLGSVRAVVNSENSVMTSQDYDQWGYFLEGRSNDKEDSKFKFTSKERDQESFYDYFGARYDDARIGRWGTIDPLLEKHFDFSPYNYVLDNPLIFYDPDGKQVFLGGESYHESKGLGQYINVNETQQISQNRFDNKRPRESGLTTTDVGLLDPVEWISGGAVTMSMRLSATVGISLSEKLVLQSLKNISKSGIIQTTEKVIEKSVKDINIGAVGKIFSDFLGGEGTRKVTNKAGDVLFLSKDNLRKVRFDINKFYPHDFKHIDIETKIGIVKSFQ